MDGMPTGDQKMHHYLGVELHNQAWNLMEKEDRTEKDDRRMEQFALGSLFHWKHSPKYEPLNSQRGEWILARVYSHLGNGRAALAHAQECMKLTVEHQIRDFDLAFAHEAMARALAFSGKAEESMSSRNSAKEAADGIAKREDRDYFLGNLEKGPWPKP